MNYEACPEYTVQLLARNSQNDVSTCVLTVMVDNENDFPYFYPPCPKLPTLCVPGVTGVYPLDMPTSTAFTVPERAKANVGVGTPFLVQDEDNGQEFTFEIDLTKGSCADLNKEDCVFRIGSCSGQLYVQKGGSALDYTKTQQYTLEIRACDDPSFFGLADSARRCSPNVVVTIDVVDVNDKPFFAVVSAWTQEWGDRVKGLDQWRRQMIDHYRIPENSAGGAAATPFCRTVQQSDGILGAAVLACDRKGGLVDDFDLSLDGNSATNVMAYSVARNDKDINNVAAFAITTCNSRVNNLDDCPSGLQAGTLVLAQGAILDYESPLLTPKRKFFLKASTPPDPS